MLLTQKNSATSWLFFNKNPTPGKNKNESYCNSDMPVVHMESKVLGKASWRKIVHKHSQTFQGTYETRKCKGKCSFWVVAPFQIKHEFPILKKKNTLLIVHCNKLIYYHDIFVKLVVHFLSLYCMYHTL